MNQYYKCANEGEAQTVADKINAEYNYAENDATAFRTAPMHYGAFWFVPVPSADVGLLTNPEQAKLVDYATMAASMPDRRPRV